MKGTGETVLAVVAFGVLLYLLLVKPESSEPTTDAGTSWWSDVLTEWASPGTWGYGNEVV